jgi:hypothetical protein
MLVSDLMVKRYSKKNKSFIKIYCLLFILAFGSIGVGYAALSDGVELRGTVHTGNIDPVFLEDIQMEIKGQGEVRTYLMDEYTIGVSVKNAYTEDLYSIRYKIANYGSIPIAFKAISSKTDPGVAVKLQNPKGVIKGHGATAEGEIMIEVGEEVSPDGTYECLVSFAISQWNTVD